MLVNPLQELEFIEIEEIEEEIFHSSEEEVKQRFKIESLEQANWAFRKMAALDAKAKEVKQLAEAERQRIQEYEQHELRSIESSRAFFESLLTIYANQQREKDPKFKVKTPYGTIGFKKQQPKWNYNEEVLVESLESLGLHDFVKVEKEPKKAEIKKSFQLVKGQVIDPETGAVIEGITVSEQPPKLDIKVVE